MFTDHQHSQNVDLTYFYGIFSYAKRRSHSALYNMVIVCLLPIHVVWGTLSGQFYVDEVIHPHSCRSIRQLEIIVFQ